jgi:hypothetical protein
LRRYTLVNATVRVATGFESTKVGRCRLKNVKTGVESAVYQHLKLDCDEPLSNFAFKFNLRRYTKDYLRFTAMFNITAGPDSHHTPRHMIPYGLPDVVRHVIGCHRAWQTLLATS